MTEMTQTTQLAPLTGSERVRRTRERKCKDIVFLSIEILPTERDARNQSVPDLYLLVAMGLVQKPPSD
jgi:hypothetical protein